MKRFTRQTSGNAPIADVNLDFGAAGAKVARLFEPGDYRLRIDSARIIQNNQNFSVVLNLIEMESGSVNLGEGEMFVVPKGIRHNPVAEEECHILLIEKKSTQHTGDVKTEKTRSLAEQLRPV